MEDGAKQRCRQTRPGPSCSSATSTFLMVPFMRTCVAPTLAAASPPSRRGFHASTAALALEVPVPEMGDSITEGTVLEWVAGVGDYVAMDDVVVVIETDKVSVEVRTPIAGAISVGAPTYNGML